MMARRLAGAEREAAMETRTVVLAGAAILGVGSLSACSPSTTLRARSITTASGVTIPSPAETFVTAQTKFVEARGTRYAYRTYGAKSDVPLVFLQHFGGSMDNWDPELVDALAKERTVVLFDNKGVSSSSGETPDSFKAMADDAADFISALGYEKVDILGFSIGGAVAQELTINHPTLVRKLILAGTAPEGGEGLNNRDPKIVALVMKPVPAPDDFLTLFFEPTPESQRLGRAFLERRKRRTKDVDPSSSEQTLRAHVKSRNDWGAAVDPGHVRLKRIAQRVLVANGSHDIMMFTPNSVTLFENIPNAQLILYPDSGHGFLFQYPDVFAAHVSLFLRD
jgi:pimeloyl-ACP methyl ester carboxylesterase